MQILLGMQLYRPPNDGCEHHDSYRDFPVAERRVGAGVGTNVRKHRRRADRLRRIHRRLLRARDDSPAVYASHRYAREFGESWWGYRC